MLVTSAVGISVPSIFCILKFPGLPKIRNSHRFVAVVIQILIPLPEPRITNLWFWEVLGRSQSWLRTMQTDSRPLVQRSKSCACAKKWLCFFKFFRYFVRAGLVEKNNVFQYCCNIMVWTICMCSLEDLRSKVLNWGVFVFTWPIAFTFSCELENFVSML